MSGSPLNPASPKTKREASPIVVLPWYLGGEVDGPEQLDPATVPSGSLGYLGDTPASFERVATPLAPWAQAPQDDTLVPLDHWTQPSAEFDTLARAYSAVPPQRMPAGAIAAFIGALTFAGGVCMWLLLSPAV